MYAARHNEGGSFSTRVWKINRLQYEATRLHFDRGSIFVPSYGIAKALDYAHESFPVRLDVRQIYDPHIKVIEDFDPEPFLIKREIEEKEVIRISRFLRELEKPVLTEDVIQFEKPQRFGVERNAS